MATIVGTLGDDAQIIDFFNADDEIFGDSTGTLNRHYGANAPSGGFRLTG